MRHDNPLTSVSFSPNGKWVVTASTDSDSSARVWDAQTGKPVGHPMKHNGSVNSASFSPDGNHVLTASDDTLARIWDAQTGEPIGQSMKHDDRVDSAFFSMDGKWVVTASGNAARVWDAQTGQPTSLPMNGGGRTKSARLSPDGKWVVTASDNDAAWVWDAVIADQRAAQWLSALAETTGGQYLNAYGWLEPSRQDPALLRWKLQKLSGDDDLSRFGRWIAANPSARTIGPLSTITMPEFIAARLQENTPGSIEEAYSADPGNPLVLAALAKLTVRTDKDEAQFYFQVALRYARLAGAPEQITQVQGMAKSLFPDAPESSGQTLGGQP
jgi:hypothetical protein